uniref:Uncharacterized protein n=1 Tax=Hemiselmis andersenii TaxID=464988 RepID=A0A6T8HBE7_HEMAN|mmetsp:Transcript_27692/g.64402  ORF Transcript_27692/g.64402 Transcript_27692/m.64402 type:complete len:601 (+) Transcript_27692:91-1893(+)
MSGYTMAELGFGTLDLVPAIPYYMEHIGEVNFWVPLYQCLIDRNIGGVRRLLSQGANVEGLLPGNPSPNDYGTSLHIAAMYCPEAIDLLVEAGADQNAKRPADGFNTLMVAAQCNNLASAKKVLALNKDLFFGSSGFFQSPIAVAEYYDSFDVLRWLLQVEERYKAGNPRWFDDEADAAHVRAMRAAQAQAEALRLAAEAEERAKAAADAEAKKKAEEEAAEQRKKAEEEAAQRKKEEEEALRLARKAEEERQRALAEAEAARARAEEEAKQALAAAEAAKDAAAAAEARRLMEEERVAREAAAAEAEARRRAAEEAERKRDERARKERERKAALEESMRLVREAEEKARAAADDEARAAAEKAAAELRRAAEKEAKAKAGPSRSGIMSRVHRLLALLEDKKEQVRVDAARELKEVVAIQGEGRTYVQEALVALCRPELQTPDESKKNAVEYLIKVVETPEDCATCVRVGGIPALVALASNLKSSGGMEQARVSSWRVLKKLTGGGLPENWTVLVAKELCTLVCEGVRSVVGYTSTNIKRERETSATCLELFTKKEQASHDTIRGDERAIASMRAMADDMHPTMEQGRDQSRRVLKVLKL